MQERKKKEEQDKQKAQAQKEKDAQKTDKDGEAKNSPPSQETCIEQALIKLIDDKLLQLLDQFIQDNGLDADLIKQEQPESSGSQEGPASDANDADDYNFQIDLSELY